MNASRESIAPAALDATLPQTPVCILIVDDDPDIVLFTQALVDDLPAEAPQIATLAAASAEEAWSILQQRDDVAVALLDVMMETPQAGLELARRIRGQPRLRCTRLILRTARTDEVPPLQTVTRFDIDAYCDKNNPDPVALLTPLVSALRTYQLLQTLEQERAQLQQTLEERDAMEIRLRQAQKLEAVGRLGAGIAHEINTPIQFIQDNMHFIAQSSAELTELVATQQELLTQAVHQTSAGAHLLESAQTACAQADFEFVKAELPLALRRSQDGLERITKIVRAMKDFAHPGQERPQPCDVNRIIDSTLTVAQRDLAHCDVQRELGELPHIAVHAGELGQALLNILLNAGQALQDQAPPRTIHLRSWSSPDAVHIQISDNGPGIPEPIRERIFDPFFTTKDFGQGTGQGLSIAHNVVVQQHRGRLELDSTQQGACFTISLPCN
nr:response regulator [Oceanococcus sp. HetDA_MAG_MS8]